MAKLVLLQGGKAVPYPLDKEQVVVGRHPECDILLESNMVSRKHARLERQGADYRLVDLGSGNGSFVNGKQLEKEGSVTLKHEDRIKLGPLLFRFEGDHKASPAPKANLSDTEPPASPGFKFAIQSGDEDISTIMGSVDGSEGSTFGMLDVQPEVKLKAVLEISRSLAGTVDLQALLPKILDTLFSIFKFADRGCILLRNEVGEMIPAAQKHRREHQDETVKLSRTILKKVLEEKTGVLSADAANDERFDAAESISSLTIRSMMCVPLLNLDGEPTGVINLDTQNPLNQFDKEDLDLLMAVAGQAALSYESARLVVSHAEKEKQDSEMRIARNVQQALLPESLPDVDGYEFYASYDAAQAVGGDYYDVFELPDNKIAISFGDVAGKGVPGALIMSRMATVVDSILQYETDVEKAVAAINNSMCARAVEGRFVTYVLAILDLNTHEFTLVNAGHMSPMIRQPSGEVDYFDDDTIGIPIGIMEDFPYDVVQRKLEPGETVVIITDGVDEAMNPAGELYSKEKVIEFISQGSANAAELGQELLADVRRHADGRPQNDDITIMTFGRNAE